MNAGEIVERLIERLEAGEVGQSVDRAFNEFYGWKKLSIGWLDPAGVALLDAPAWSEHPHVGPHRMATLLKESRRLT